MLIPDRQDQFTDTFDYYRYLLAETPPHYRYWFPLGGESTAGKAFITEVLPEYAEA